MDDEDPAHTGERHLSPPRRSAGREDLLPTAPPVTELTDPDDFTHVLDEILSRAIRRRRDVSVVMLEVTRTGRSTFIERLAKDLARVVRNTDRMWRIGPRTLMILLADVDGAQAVAAVGRLRVWMSNQAMVPLAMAWSTAPPGIGAEGLVELLRGEIDGAAERDRGEGV